MNSHTKRIGLPILIMLAGVFVVFSAGQQEQQEQTEATESPAQTEPGVRTVTNLDGKVIELPREVTSVATLYGPSYEKVVLLGAEEKIILCADFHKKVWPWALEIFDSLEDVPVMSKPWDPNMEEVVKADPDVVFFRRDVRPNARRSSPRRAQGHGIGKYFLCS